MTTPYLPFWSRVRRKIGIGEPPNPHRFLGYLWHGLVVSNIVCLGVAAWLFFQEDSRFYIWLVACAFMTFGPMAMNVASVALLPDSRRKFIGSSIGMALCVLSLGWLIQDKHPMLLGAVLWFMLLLFSFHSRLHDRREIGWTQHEDSLAVASTALALAAYLLQPVAPWLMLALLVFVPSLHRVVLWTRWRAQKMALEQHTDIWPRMAKTKPANEFWSAIILYITVHNGIPPQALRHTLTKIDIDTLLAYFGHDSVLLFPDSLVWHHRDLEAAVKERICALDERAVVVFELYGKDTRHAAHTIKSMRSGLHTPQESVPLPDLGSAS